MSEYPRPDSSRQFVNVRPGISKMSSAENSLDGVSTGARLARESGLEIDLKIPIEKIFPDPGLPQEPAAIRAAERHRGRASETPIVQPNADGGYVLVSGRRGIRAAREAGAEVVEVKVRTRISRQERQELRLSEQYHNALAPPMVMAKEFYSYRKTHGITQQELARRTGITPGTIHHYESLIRTLDPRLGRRVDAGELTFKEARSIADIDGHKRQREIAEPFLSGRLSSVHVERIVGRAKSSPELTIEQLIAEVVDGDRQAAPEPAPQPEAPEPDPQQLPPQPMEITTLESTALMLAGELGTLPLQVIPEYRRLNLIRSLRILDSRLRSALTFLNSGQAVESGIPRPLSHVGSGR